MVDHPQALHEHSHNRDEALASLVPTSGPNLCRDELEDWRSAEENLFEKYSKDFNEIKKDFLPLKSMRKSFMCRPTPGRP